MKLSYLRYLMLLDAGVLFWLGAFLIFAPGQVETAFHFQGLPTAVNYLLALWGCMFVTLAWGYTVAAQNPIRHRIWIQVGIARGLLECLLGIVFLSRGVVTGAQAGIGTVVAGIIAVLYLALYPRRPSLPAPAQQPQASPGTP